MELLQNNLFKSQQGSGGKSSTISSYRYQRQLKLLTKPIWTFESYPISAGAHHLTKPEQSTSVLYESNNVNGDNPISLFGQQCVGLLNTKCSEH